MKSFLLSNRGIFSIIALCAILLIGVALYMEKVMGLEPCNLCMFQRIFVVLAGIVALAATLHGPKQVGAKLYASFVALLSIVGGMIAGRQIWLQHLPEDQVPACGPGLDYMMDVYPFMEMIEEVLRGSGDCAKVQWTFLNLSIPEWTIICFASATILSLYILLRKSKLSV